LFNTIDYNDDDDDDSISPVTDSNFVKLIRFRPMSKLRTFD